MAEIYKRQLQHNAQEPSKVNVGGLQNYISNGLSNADNVSRALGESIAKINDARVAGVMEKVAQDASQTVDDWRDFSTEGRAELERRLEESYVNAINGFPSDAQNRFNTNNPYAKDLFQLKYKEKINQKIKSQLGTTQDYNLMSYAQTVMRSKDADEARRRMTEIINQEEIFDLDGILSVEEAEKKKAKFWHDSSKASISQAIIDGRSEDAISLLNDHQFVKHLSVDEITSLQKELKSLQKTQSASASAGADSETVKEVSGSLISARDFLMAVTPQDEEGNVLMPVGATSEGRLSVDMMMARFVTDIQNGVPIEIIASTNPMFTNGTMTQEQINALKSFADLPMSVRQLAGKKYFEVMSNISPELSTYKERIEGQFNDLLPVIMGDDGEIDIQKITPEQAIRFREISGDLKQIEGFLSENSFENYKRMDTILFEKDQRAAAILEAPDVAQDMVGIGHWFGGPQYPLFGNNSPNIVNELKQGASKEEENRTLMGILLGIPQAKSSEYSGKGTIDSEITSLYGGKPSKESLNYLGDPDKYVNPTDSAYSRKNRQVMDRMIGLFAQEMGESKIPQRGTYRYMAYAIPVLFNYISKHGFAGDEEILGIKLGQFDGHAATKVANSLLAMYKDVLDKPADDFNTSTIVPDDSGNLSTSAINIRNSMLYDMAKNALSISYAYGYAKADKPNEEALIDIAMILRKATPGDSTLQAIGRAFTGDWRSDVVQKPRKNSDFSKRMSGMPQKVKLKNKQ